MPSTRRVELIVECEIILKLLVSAFDYKDCTAACTNQDETYNDHDEDGGKRVALARLFLFKVFLDPAIKADGRIVKVVHSVVILQEDITEDHTIIHRAVNDHTEAVRFPS